MRKNYMKFVFLLPAVVWVLTFTIYPLISALQLSFFTYRLGMGIGEFVGFGNYLDLFKSPDFWNSLRVMFIYVGTAVSIEIGLGLGLAWVFARDQWLSTGNWAMVAIILLDVWRWTPFAFIILLAAFHSVPNEMYEAASLDTSSDFQVFRHITFPVILPAFTIVILLRLIEAFKQFGLVFSLTEGGPGRTTEIYCVLNYRTSIKYFDFGHGSAMAFLLLLIAMIVVIQFFGRMRKIYE